MHARLQQRKSMITNLKRKIAAQAELVENAPSEDSITRDKDALQAHFVSEETDMNFIFDMYPVSKNQITYPLRVTVE